MSETVEVLAGLEPLRTEWSTLGERTGNLFATWEWNSTCWAQLGDGRQRMCAVVRDADRTLVGILPMQVDARAGPLRILRLLAHDAGDRLGPICLPGDRDRVAAALRTPLWANTLLLAEHLPAEEGWGERLGARPIAHEASPVLELDTRVWDEFLAGRSAGLRQQIRRRERRLVREHGMRFRLVEDAAELPAALDALFSLHGARWRRATDFGGAQRLHRAFAERALGRRWLRLWLMEIEGRPVAAWHGFRFGGADWYYQSGRDPAWDTYSVGTVLLAHTIRDCVEAGLSRYLFLRGDEPYKQRFATSDPGLETVALGSGSLGRAALVAGAAASRLPPTARRRVIGALGR